MLQRTTYQELYFRSPLEDHRDVRPELSGIKQIASPLTLRSDLAQHTSKIVHPPLLQMTGLLGHLMSSASTENCVAVLCKAPGLFR